MRKLLCLVFGHMFEYVDGHFNDIGSNYYGKYSEIYVCRRCGKHIKLQIAAKI